MSDFDAGYQAGLNASHPEEDAFQLSTFSNEWKVGYVVACAKVASVRAAYPDGYPITAGELAARYFMPTEPFRAHIAPEDWRQFMESNRAESKEMADKFEEEEGFD